MYQPISLKVGTYWDLYKTNPYGDFKIKVFGSSSYCIIKTSKQKQYNAVKLWNDAGISSLWFDDLVWKCAILLKG